MSLKTIYEFSLDIKLNNYVAIRVKRGDKKSRLLKISCTDNGREYQLTDDLTTSLQIMTADKTPIEVKCEIDTTENVILCTLDSNMIPASGVSSADLVLYDATKSFILSTMSFRIFVEDTVITKEIANSMPQSQTLSELIVIGNQKIAELEEAIKNAGSSSADYAKAEQSRVEAEKGRVNAEKKRVQAETSRAEAEKTRATKETERINAENLRVENERTRTTQEDARVKAETKRQSDSTTAINNINKVKDEVQRKLNAGEFIGDSAYEEAVKNGFKGTEQEWLNSLRYDHSDEFTTLAAQINEDAEEAKTAAQGAKTSESNAKKSETNAKTSETKAAESEEAAKASEDASKLSETNAKKSETAAKASETKALTSEQNAKASEDKAKASEEITVKEAEKVEDCIIKGLYEQGMTYLGKASNKGIKLHSVQGKSEQVTTKGYQLFDASKLPTKSQGGATVTNNGDGSFTISGSGTLSEENIISSIINKDELNLKVGKLYFKQGAIVLPYCYVNLYKQNKVYKVISMNGIDEMSIDVTQDFLDSDWQITFGIASAVGQTIKTGTIKPMLYQQGDGTWEPFTGGKPSPNPEYEQEIESVEVKEISSFNRNLFDYENSTISDTNVKIGDNSYKLIKSTNRVVNVYFDKILPKGTYTISFDVVNSSVTKGIFINVINDKLKEELSFVEFPNGVTSKTVTIKKPFDRLYVYIDNKEVDSASITIKNLQIEKGTSKTDYVAHKSSIKKTNLTLRSLPNGVRDTYENSVIIRRVGIIKLDGSSDEKIGVSPSASNLFFKTISDYIGTKEDKIEIMCDKLQVVLPTFGVTNMTEYQIKQGGTVGNKSVFIKMPSDITTTEQMNTWLSQNPIEIRYELATPIIEKVNVPTIPSYYPYTNVWTDNQVETDMQWELLSSSDNSLEVEELNADINTIETTLGELEEDVNSLSSFIPSSIPQNHNSIYRGMDLLSKYTLQQIHEMIQDGSFRDIYIGDYFDLTINSETLTTKSQKVRCVVAGLDTYLRTGDTEVTKHHAVIITKNCVADLAKMNATNVTTGGYFNSEMYTNVIPMYDAAFTNALTVNGTSYLLSHRDLLSNQTSNDVASAGGAGWKGGSTNWGWYSVKTSLLSEVEVYGVNVWSSSGYDVGIAYRQLPLFQLNPSTIIADINYTGGGRRWYWLKNVGSSALFAYVHSYGLADCGGAGSAGGVRLRFLFS